VYQRRRAFSTTRVTKSGVTGWTWIATIGLLVICAPVHAERRRVRIGVQPLYVLALTDRRDPSGGGVGADVAYNLTDGLALRATGLLGWHAADGMTPGTAGGTMSSFGAFAGITYALDVVRIVPSFDVGVGVLGLRGTDHFSSGALVPNVTAFAVELGFGFDWLVTHRWSLGAVVRYQAMLSTLDKAPGFLYAGPRVSLTLP
jgi:hypothetical protein